MSFFRFGCFLILSVGFHSCGNDVQQASIAKISVPMNIDIPEKMTMETPPPVVEKFEASLTDSICTVMPQYPDGPDGSVKWAIKGSGNCGPDTEDLANNNFPDAMVRITTGEMLIEEIPCIGTMWNFPESFQLSGTGHLDISYGNATGVADCSYPGTGYPSCRCNLDEHSNPECEYKIGLTKSTNDFKSDPANQCAGK